ncbi:siderophore-interacting protein [Streptomyces sp. MS1.HAVA.3]|uniref:Siderophore-interacting protein n=1 Tax=Streptomyces caledonius TaxID=3134107 RepID=A0ABU8U033_9ACTN
MAGEIDFDFVRHDGGIASSWAQRAAPGQLAEMPAGTRARVFVEVGEDSHRQELPTKADAEVTWLVRDGAPAGRSDLLERALRDMEWLPGTVFVWAAGEAVTLKGIRVI